MSNKRHSIIDGKHFKFLRSEITKSGSKTIAECLLCENGKEVSGGAASTGNFYIHLKRFHSTEYEEVIKKRKLSESESNGQQTLQHMVKGVTKAGQKSVDKLILNYIVKSMKPLSTVSDPHFIKLIKGIAQDSEMKIMSRYALDNELENLYKQTVSNLRNQISSLQYICLTADCWSSHARAFFGVTCHWIDSGFVRQSRTLACMRFLGTHSYDKIAEKLIEVMDRYGIARSQVVSIVTDNGSNFCKAFREFSVNFEHWDESEDEEEPAQAEERIQVCEVLDPEGNSIAEFANGYEDEEEEDFYHEPISGMLSSTSKASDLKLPPHFRCISHSLSLVATTDLRKAKGRKMYNKAIGKCTKLWNLSTSPKSAEIIIKCCGQNFIRPVPTRWNSLYNAVDRLLAMKKGLNDACVKLGVPTFSSKELEFLQEYSRISAPVAIALDRMQGESGLFMGAVIPTLKQTEKKLSELLSESKQCDSFVQAYLDGIKKRFDDILNFNIETPSELVFAAMCHPYYKLRWISATQHDKLKKAFVDEAHKYFDSKLQENTTKTEIDDFFDFEEDQSENSAGDHVELECVKYFNDPSRVVSMLLQYPTIQKMFLRFNTGLPSSAPVERLFSYGGLIFSSRRCRLADKKFEQLILLKCNSIIE